MHKLLLSRNKTFQNRYYCIINAIFLKDNFISFQKKSLFEKIHCLVFKYIFFLSTEGEISLIKIFETSFKFYRHFVLSTSIRKHFSLCIKIIFTRNIVRLKNGWCKRSLGERGSYESNRILHFGEDNMN